jgi:hypothetical protein
LREGVYNPSLGLLNSLPFSINSSRRVRLSITQDRHVNHVSLPSINYTYLSEYQRYLEDREKDNSEIEFSLDLAMHIRDYLIENIDKDISRIRYPSAKKFDSAVRYQSYRLLLALKAYEDCDYLEACRMSREFLINGVLDKDFASKLKAQRLKSFLNSNHVVLNPPELRDYALEEHQFLDVGMVFNYSYWIFWKEEDPKDYLAGITEKFSFSESQILRFKDALRRILPESTNAILEEEILLENSFSTCSDVEDPSHRSKVYKEKELHNNFSAAPLRGRRVIIPVGPGNIRDSITLPLPQLNSVKLIEKQCTLIARDLPYSAYGLTDDEFEETLRKFSRNYTYFYDRDITKEGITKPRELLIAILEVLEEKYPKLPAWKYKGIYSDYFLFVENEWINPNRGHGLGMANALTTILQCTLNELIVDEIEKSDEIMVGEEYGFLTYNDDYTAGFQTESDLLTYSEFDQKILEEFHIILSKKKTHGLRDSFVFCERYYPDNFNRKESYRRTELSYIYLMKNIYEAKVFFSSIASRVSGELLTEYMEKAVSFWGYEFFPDEWKYPFTFGGWINPSINGVRLDFFDLVVKPQCIEAYLACKERYVFKKKKRDSNRIYLSPFSQIYGEEVHLPEDFSSYFKVNTPFWKIRGESELYKNDKVYNKIIDIIAEKRQRKFRESKFCCLSLEEVFLDFLETHPLTEVLPPRSMIRNEEIIEDTESDIKYMSDWVPNQRLSFIKYFNEKKIDRTQIPNPYPFLGLVNSLDPLLAIINERVPGIHLGTVRGDPDIVQIYDKVIRSKSDLISLDNNRYVTAYCNITGLKAYPIYVKDVSRKVVINEEPYIQNVRKILRSSKRDIFIKLCEEVSWHQVKEYVINSQILEFLEQFQSVKLLPRRKRLIKLTPIPLKEEIGDNESVESIPIEKSEWNPTHKELNLRDWIHEGRPKFDPKFKYDMFLNLWYKNESNRQANLDLSSNPDEAIKYRQLFDDFEKLFIEQANLIILDRPDRNQVFFSDDESSEEETSYGLSMFDE